MSNAVNASAEINASFYAKGYAEGLRDAHDHDVAGLIEDLDRARACLEFERIIRRDFERQIGDLKERLAAETVRRAA
ncbi:hypothetical protein NKJ26_03185 [Mesorhizobium sp. M0152]|uniref:hypothetical protein n=1 Tax=Mesorhizobium sp. M0152 TaxID=2956898 RepID=UPI00333930C4